MQPAQQKRAAISDVEKERKHKIMRLLKVGSLLGWLWQRSKLLPVELSLALEAVVTVADASKSLQLSSASLICRVLVC